MIEIGTNIKSFALPNNGKGIITKQYKDRKGYNGEDLYDVLDENGKIHTMVPSLFDSIEENNIKDINPNLEENNKVNIKEIENEIEMKILEIIDNLKLKSSNDIMTQLKNCCVVQKYIVENNNYDNNIMNEKKNYNPEDIVTLDLYNALVLHNGVCTSNSLMFKKILEKVGIKVEVIGSYVNETDIMHASNLVELDGMYYFFDSTLETTIYQEKSCLTNGQIILCCAGLGKKEYCQFYNPQVVLPDNPLDKTKKIPDNIALNRIPQDIINSLINYDLTSKR